MMNRSIMLLTMAGVLCTCQEYYTDPDITAGSEYIVIEGTITNEPGPYRIRISRTWPYNRSADQVQDTVQVSGAVVVISDNTGMADTCLESWPGWYYTTGIRGETGKSYLLDILMPDGTAYRSESCTMADPAGFDSIYAEQGRRTVLNPYGTGSYFEKIQDGLYLYVDARAPATEYYFKIDTRVVKEILHMEWSIVPSGDSYMQLIKVYCWEISTLHNDKDLVSSLTGSTELIRKQPAGFVTPEKVKAGQNYLIGVFATTTISALPKRIFEIFTQLDRQSDPSNSLFDPIPTRIETNIACTNDPGRLVLGYFSAAAISRKMRFFRLKTDGVEAKDMNPGYILPVVDDCTGGVLPDFWIDH